MNQSVVLEKLTKLFESHFLESIIQINPLPQSGSNRKYFRLSSENYTAIGAYNTNVKENEAFFSFTNTFLELQFNVPTIYGIDEDRQHYVVRDLGDETLYDSINRYFKSENQEFPRCCIKNSIENLIDFQIEGAKHIDFSKCHPRDKFDRRSIQWDLNYFKYNFLKLVDIPFDEELLENDFQTIIEEIEATPADYFMFRDFQSRNILLFENNTWFIDYQGGRKGPLQYDLASILYSPKTHLNIIEREILLQHYIKKLKERIDVDDASFIRQYYVIVLARILQALGAYGYRGLFEKKNTFIQSIPIALKNLNFIFTKKLELEVPEIKKISDALISSKWAVRYRTPENKLTIRITSFSYKNGIPSDPSENGGGFAFDCRGLPNPGRLTEYKKQSGLDQPVIKYLEQFPEVEEFQQSAQKMMAITIDEYLRRGFTHLCINFGCTGGQHRSVYNAEKMYQWIQNNYPANLVITHTEQSRWKNYE